MFIGVLPQDPSGVYFPGEPVTFRFEQPPLKDHHLGISRVETYDYRVATLQPLDKPSEFWLVWFVSEYEKPHAHSTKLLLQQEEGCRVFWCGEGRCQAGFGKGGPTRLDLPLKANTIKALEQQYGDFKGEGAWLARLLKPGGLHGEITQVENDYLCYARLA
jgi:hypothetical protein